MESSTNIPLSVDWQNSKNKVWNLRAYIVTAVMALAAPGCTTTMPTYNACSDSVYISSLATSIGQSKELLRIKRAELWTMRSSDHKNKITGNGTLRVELGGEISRLELNIRNMEIALRRCNHYQSRMSSI